MQRFIVRQGVPLILALCTIGGAAQGAVYEADYDEGQWQATTPSPLQCELTHYIPRFGQARFIHRAGEDTKFQIKPFRSALKQGSVQLVAMAPGWRPGTGTHQIGHVQFRTNDEWVKVGPQQTALMIESLRQGLMPSMLQEDQDQRIEARVASISPLRFDEAYSRFQLCEAQLLPVNYDQISNTVLNYASGADTLSVKDKAMLDLIVRYIKADPDVSYVFIDSHTDSRGTRRDNRQLSKNRADMVLNYLIARGLDQEMITSRYHGERYPVASNATVSGRAQNRRVTVRLEKENEVNPL